MWPLWVFLGIVGIIVGGYFFAKWRLKKKGWKAGGGFWLAVFLVYSAVWAYLMFSPTKKKIQKEREQEKTEIKIDTIQKA